jgi:hypothetical protein
MNSTKGMAALKQPSKHEKKEDNPLKSVEIPRASLRTKKND